MKKNLPLILQIGCLLFVVGVVYVWEVSFGRWEKWPKTTNFYDLQVDAFLHGQIPLLIHPDPKLIALSDPYEMNLRNSSRAQSIFDLSLYKGNYYLYWGALPALLITPIKLFYAKEIGDHQITFFALTFLLLVNCSFAFAIWKDNYEAMPAWLLLLGIAVLGTVNPIPWLLHRGAAYQAAISCGQLFLIAAIYLFYLAFRSDHTNILLLYAASLLLCFSFASRFILLPAAVFILIMISTRYSILRSGNWIKFEWLNWAIFAPLIVSLIALGWYNKVRFDSFTEFGLTYQINEVNYTKHPTIFSLAYVPANIYNYFFLPFQFLKEFPYVIYTVAVEKRAFGFSIPEMYAPVAVSGIFAVTPFVLMAGIPIFLLIRQKLQDENLKWLIITLAGTTALSMGVVFLYFIAAMRFIMDFMPSLALLAVIGFWQGCKELSKTRFEWPFKITGILLAIPTIFVGIVLAMASISRVPRLPESVMRILTALSYLLK